VFRNLQNLEKIKKKVGVEKFYFSHDFNTSAF
jgi:hypothetical protein